jgi:hypothetical protein
VDLCPAFCNTIFNTMKKKPEIKEIEMPETAMELNDEVGEFIKRKKIQNKVLKEIIEKLNNSTERENKRSNH